MRQQEKEKLVNTHFQLIFGMFLTHLFPFRKN